MPSSLAPIHRNSFRAGQAEPPSPGKVEKEEKVCAFASVCARKKIACCQVISEKDPTDREWSHQNQQQRETTTEPCFSWLNPGQIVIHREAFGPLQPAVVGILSDGQPRAPPPAPSRAEPSRTFQENLWWKLLERFLLFSPLSNQKRPNQWNSFFSFRVCAPASINTPCLMDK